MNSVFFFLPHAIKNHKVPACFLVLVGDEQKVCFLIITFFSFVQKPKQQQNSPNQ